MQYLQKADAVTDRLPFDLVDIKVDFKFFDGLVYTFETGSKQNMKISAMTNHLCTILVGQY
jgi:hypothetical protein